MKEVIGIPDYIIYRRKRYYFVPDSVRGTKGDLLPKFIGTKWDTKYTGTPLIVLCHDPRGSNYPEHYAIYAKLA
jgi:hypothetical protein